MKKLLILVVFLSVVVISAFWWWANHPDVESYPASQTVSVYFLDLENFNVGREPYETAATRNIEATVDPKTAILAELMKGPTSAEQASGLAVEKSAATGLRLEFNNETGLARVYLEGGCDSRGSSYTIANLIVKNLRQFPDVKRVYIYDPAGATLGAGNEPFDLLPACLQP